MWLMTNNGRRARDTCVWVDELYRHVCLSVAKAGEVTRVEMFMLKIHEEREKIDVESLKTMYRFNKIEGNPIPSS